MIFVGAPEFAGILLQVGRGPILSLQTQWVRGDLVCSPSVSGGGSPVQRHHRSMAAAGAFRCSPNAANSHDEDRRHLKERMWAQGVVSPNIQKEDGACGWGPILLHMSAARYSCPGGYA